MLSRICEETRRLIRGHKQKREFNPHSKLLGESPAVNPCKCLLRQQQTQRWRKQTIISLSVNTSDLIRTQPHAVRTGSWLFSSLQSKPERYNLERDIWRSPVRLSAVAFDRARGEQRLLSNKLSGPETWLAETPGILLAEAGATCASCQSKRSQTFFSRRRQLLHVYVIVHIPSPASFWCTQRLTFL